MIDAPTARRLLSAHGVTQTQPATDWDGTFPLPPALDAFYREVGPVDVTIDGFGNPYFLPSLARLWQYQAGYRWNSKTGEPAVGWNDDWIVVAAEGADPFIFSRAHGNVSRADHGTGTWTLSEVFSDLNAMAACLGILGSVVASAGDALLDDDFNIRAIHIDSAKRQLAKLLGDEQQAEAILGSLGWIA